jgi:hypothetical protein
MNIATIVAAACSAVLLVAPPKQPSWWVSNPTPKDLEILLLHGRDADEITVDDMKLMFTLHNEHLLLLIWDAYIQDKIKEEPSRRMSWDDVKFEMERVRSLFLKNLAEMEEKNQKEQQDKPFNSTT